MESSGILSIGSYLRKMALDGYCLHLDLQELRRMAYLLQMCSNNLNQYTKPPMKTVRSMPPIGGLAHPAG